MTVCHSHWHLRSLTARDDLYYKLAFLFVNRKSQNGHMPLLIFAFGSLSFKI